MTWYWFIMPTSSGVAHFVYHYLGQVRHFGVYATHHTQEMNLSVAHAISLKPLC